MKFCPECGAKLVSQKFCQECGENLSNYLHKSTDSLGSFDFSALEKEANKQLTEQIGLQVEGQVLVKYTGKSRDVVIPRGITEIFDEAFKNNEVVATVEIPEGVKLIGKSAFAGCKYLKKITIPSTVEEIYESAFEGCCELESITLPNILTRIRAKLFYGCGSLSQINIPNSVTAIDWCAFCGCGITNINIPDSVTSIGSNQPFGSNLCIGAFSGTGLTSVSLPKHLTYIDSYTFYSCTQLSNVTIPIGIKSIGGGAFYKCPIDEIHYEGTVDDWAKINIVRGNSIGDLQNALPMINKMYFNNKLATEITISTDIPDKGFCYWNTLQKVVVAPNVKSIGDYAFKGCTALKEIKILGNNTLIGHSAFSGCSSLEKLEMHFANTDHPYPLGYYFGGERYTGGEKTEQLYMNSYNDVFCIPTSLKKLTVTAGTMDQYSIINCHNLTEVTIGEAVNFTSSFSYCNCQNLKTVTAPKQYAALMNSCFPNSKIITY